MLTGRGCLVRCILSLIALAALWGLFWLTRLVGWFVDALERRIPPLRLNGGDIGLRPLGGQNAGGVGWAGGVWNGLDPWPSRRTTALAFLAAWVVLLAALILIASL
jgi:hypothetical protein